MHEWHLAANIVEKIEKAAAENGLRQVTRAEILLGRGLGIAESEFSECLKISTNGKKIFAECCFDIKLVESNLASIENIEGD
ncbi:MAG: hypothetical protein A2339_07760 [Elusimicrobia bacterium RIFOXYB12_FULL_50_12]|nr:MAG: hypothetical protein A2278_02970 [Elusimicrobia bacterium RIFOXYA12_FULL_49_49]OGS10139.1 MAG: hypothetical protein A2386_02920 [Elusimicrobia bacterium RIFOXYB1_FULL_48_9]OGS16444.1 MAG: hypothetical protein A2251_06425 [Elusimicrobia bacterium RIFOXYA2_FULL_47_53]OGS27181.1 MAG: hypothetical protein A2339_07760 [Elusimicrobia bacterium RIFOXYB12_FULL_50_12]OGS30380.1 MAG: hypothetical protein A2323_02620 [Elusimicrobia bacterium RIFOXYB2_FULL_46_23]